MIKPREPIANGSNTPYQGNGWSIVIGVFVFALSVVGCTGMIIYLLTHR